MAPACGAVNHVKLWQYKVIPVYEMLPLLLVIEPHVLQFLLAYSSCSLSGEYRQ